MSGYESALLCPILGVLLYLHLEVESVSRRGGRKKTERHAIWTIRQPNHDAERGPITDATLVVVALVEGLLLMLGVVVVVSVLVPYCRCVAPA